MIPKFLILILFPILLTMVYLGSSDENVVGIAGFGVLAVGLFCTFVVKTPVWGALLLIIGTHWFQLEGISYTIYLMLLSTSCFLVYALERGDFRIDRPWLLVALTQFGYTGLVFVLKPYPVMKVFFFANITVLIFFLGASLIRWNADNVQKLLTAHLAFMVVWAFIERAVSLETRIVGPSLSSTNFAVLLAVSWTIWFINGWISGKTHGIWLGLMSLGVVIAIFFSGTRMGVLGVGLGAVLGVLSKLMILQRTRMVGLLMKFGIIFAVMAVAAMALWSLVPDDLFLKQGMNNFVNGKLDASSMGRIGAWITAVGVIKDHPVWGVGSGNFLAYNAELLKTYSFIPMVETLPRLGHAHNLLLMVLSEHGLVGFTVLASACVACLLRLVRYIRRNWDGFGFALMSGGIVTLFLGLFDVFPLFPSSLGWGAWFMAVLFSLRSQEASK